VCPNKGLVVWFSVVADTCASICMTPTKPRYISANSYPQKAY